MKKYFVLLLVIPFIAFSQQQTRDNLITVMGYAESEVEPDIIVLSMSAKENENSKDESSSAKMENNIMKFLISIGIKAENFTLDRYNANSRYSFTSTTKFKLNKSYKLVFNQVSQLDTIMAKCLESGMENLAIQRLDYSKKDSLENTLLVNALKSAQNKAMIIGKTLSSNVGKVYSVNENQQNSITGFDNDMTGSISVVGYGIQAKNRIGSDISIQKIKFSKTILAKFAIE